MKHLLFSSIALKKNAVSTILQAGDTSSHSTMSSFVAPKCAAETEATAREGLDREYSTAAVKKQQNSSSELKRLSSDKHGHFELIYGGWIGQERHKLGRFCVPFWGANMQRCAAAAWIATPIFWHSSAIPTTPAPAIPIPTPSTILKRKQFVTRSTSWDPLVRAELVLFLLLYCSISGCSSTKEGCSGPTPNATRSGVSCAQHTT